MALRAMELSPDEVVKRGKAIYQKSIRDEVDQDHIGKLLMVDVTTGNWVIGEDRIEMARLLRERNPNTTNYAIRVGYPATSGIGATVRPLSDTRNH